MTRFYKPEIEYFYKSQEMCQIKLPIEPHDRWAKNSIYKIGSFIDGVDDSIAPEIPLIEIDKRAKLTDVLSGEMFVDLVRGLTISKNLANLLPLMKIPKYKLYNLRLSQNSNLITDYFRFVIFDTGFSYINFQKSSFTYFDNKFDKKNGIPVKANSFMDLEKYFLPKTPETVKNILITDKLVLNENFNFDIFNLYHFGGYFVSENFKNSFEKNGFTGMRFEEAPNIISED